MGVLTLLGLLVGCAEQPSFAIHAVTVGARLEAVRAGIDAAAPSEARATRDGGRKEVWRFAEGDYAWIAVKADAAGVVTWITGARRGGRELTFEALVERLGAPAVASDVEAVWYPAGPAPARLIAKGRNRRASILTMIALDD
jgi:hypothetical protein